MRCKNLGIKIRFPASNQTFVDKQITINDAFRCGDITKLTDRGFNPQCHKIVAAIWYAVKHLDAGFRSRNCQAALVPGQFLGSGTQLATDRARLSTSMRTGARPNSASNVG